MGQPGRQYSAGTGYRFGFNGKENDNEVKGEGNQQDYGMRIYDPRLGKFLSLDPLSKKYPELTPYQFASNRVIDGIDLDGLEFANWKSAIKKSLYGVAALDYNNIESTFLGPVEHQRYHLESHNPTHSVKDLMKQVTTEIGSIYNTPQGLFTWEKQQKKGEINVGDYIKITPDALTAPAFTDIWVKVTAVNNLDNKETSTDGFSFTLRTLEGHVEVGSITFKAMSIKNKGETKFIFDIESVTQISPEIGKFLTLFTDKIRKAQYKTWAQTLRNVNDFMIGKDSKANRTAKEYSVNKWYGYKIIINDPLRVAVPNKDAVPNDIKEETINLHEK